ncbi:uncharacterized protein TNCT_694481 [Trichonephila clavata]|uniref:CCHC-type domain-containing protein n=1 Tax=Trichonephila clavata TaxID=2740835 RepID=A0A8X6EZZ5_TRICU|nr:uncharacterized protein TNCT_694481 [Trichonephila clavata]
MMLPVVGIADPQRGDEAQTLQKLGACSSPSSKFRHMILRKCDTPVQFLGLLNDDQSPPQPSLVQSCPHCERCFSCQSYGHRTASCRGVATCNKCSGTEHASEACTTERRKCANCKGEHAAYSKICTKWQQEKEIQIIKVLENLSYSEARKRVVNILPPRTSSSYANAVMTNTKSKKDIATQTDIRTQTEISNIETPTNIDNLTSESHTDSPIAQKPITNNLIEQETTLSPPETSFTDLESLNLDKWSPETLHLSVPSNTEVLMEIDKSSTKRPATDNVQEAAKILKPSTRTESGGIQITKEVEDVILLSKKGKSRQSYLPIKYNSEKPKGSP